ncbi:hypothetical protein EDC01DRAFT_323985 [Geopyxis carbonaria]|nr:hypothetical protein EDC01DRAFT_323985 [Geopyxis carbonaria]
MAHLKPSVFFSFLCWFRTGAVSPFSFLFHFCRSVDFTCFSRFTHLIRTRVQEQRGGVFRHVCTTTATHFWYHVPAGKVKAKVGRSTKRMYYNSYSSKVAVDTTNNFFITYDPQLTYRARFTIANQTFAISYFAFFFILISDLADLLRYYPKPPATSLPAAFPAQSSHPIAVISSRALAVEPMGSELWSV